MLLLGIDLGSSSKKASVINGESGKCLAEAFYPKDEMKIILLKTGWAEQETEVWWTNLKAAIGNCMSQLGSGNFTASKLAWVKENEPELCSKNY